MFNEAPIACCLRLAFSGGVIGLALTALPTYAQDVQRGEKVEITGTRIKTFDPEGASPVVVIGAETISFDAVRSVESLLNNLPQVFASYGAQVSNGATGTATVDLRGLGPSRTLVLVNGRRLPAGSPLYTPADLNQIPVPLIQRVEVLTGGASAVYGSDAVAGVINFILKDNFEGVEAQANQSFSSHNQQNGPVQDAVRRRNFLLPGDVSSDAKVTDFSLTMGGNFANGKGNATLFFGYKKEDPLLQSQRDFSACAVAPAGDRFNCGGSSTSFPGRFITANGSLTVADAAGNTRPWVASRDLYNFAPLNYFQRPSERYSFNSLAHLDLSDKVRAYSELSFMDYQTVAQIAPSGLFGFDASGANAVRFENPLLSADWKSKLGLVAPGDTADVLILRRNVEGGGRQDDLRNTSYRGVLGLKGDIGPWSYDAFAQIGRVVYQETYKNDFSISRSARALDVVTDPATGNPVCRSKLNGTDLNCVPYNIWALGQVTPEALAYLQTPGFQKGFTSQTVVGASLTGDLGAYGIKLPTATSGVGVAVGAERRVERLELSTDTAFSTGDLAGQGGPRKSVAGQYSVKDLYGELRVPLVEKRPFAYLLSANGSYRRSVYSTGPKTDTYGAGVEWAPIKEVKFRGSYSRAVRAANVIELFTPQGVGLFNMDSDPCAGASPSATLAECARTGVTAAQYGTIPDSAAQQYNALFGGNQKLQPETADSYTFGVILAPVRGLNVSLDYFNIKIKNVISTLPPTTTLTQCLATGDPTFCSLITRDRIGSLWATPQAQIVATNANVAARATQGIDIGADYTMRLGAGYGGLNLSFLGTYLQKFVAEDYPGSGKYDCAGLYGNTCGNPNPVWRHKLRATWSTPWKIDLALTWRHLDAVKRDATSSNPLLTGPVAPIVRQLGSRDYFDIAGAYALNKNIMLRAAVLNLFDRDPPIADTGAPFGNGNTYPVVYDAFGRRISLNLTATF